MRRIVLAVVVGALGLGSTLAGGLVLASTSASTAPSPAELAEFAEIPPGLAAVYQAAAASCPGLPWPVLAAVGWVESRHGDGHVDPATGQVDPPIVGPALDGRDGRARLADPTSPDGYAHALGPLQVLPTTWAAWATLAPRRPTGATPDPQNAWDAAYTAARILCAGRPQVGDVAAALFAYNHSAAYVDAVLAKAAAYAGTARSDSSAQAVDPGPGRTFPGDPNTVVAAALGQLGVPYVWGGHSPGVALDCSGLVVVAYRAAGIALPRTTFEQVAYGVTVPVADLAAGDLLFARGGEPAHDLGHVALYLGDGLEVVAPHTGDVVRVHPVPYASIQLARRVLTGP